MPNEPIYVEKTLFLGRVEEQKQFRNALKEVLAAPLDEDLPYIILLHGDGGMGKTTLAKRFRDIAQIEQPFESEFQILWIDWEEERNRSTALKVGRENINPEDVFNIIHTHCVNKNWGRYFSVYQEAVKKRIEAEKKVVDIVSSSGERDEFTPLRGAGASAIAQIIRLSLPIGEAGEKFVQAFLDAGIKVGAEQAASLRAALENRLRSRLDSKLYGLFLNPNEQLARALANGLREVSNNHTLIIFLDTYEVVDQADLWLRVVMCAAGLEVVWVIGGRDNLYRSRSFGQGYFKGYADEFPRRLLHYDLGQLAEQDIRTIFNNRAPNRSLDDAVVEGIKRATLGVPLAIDEAAEMWARGIPLEEIVGDPYEIIPRHEIVQKMTARYLLHAVTDDTDKIALYALALAQGDIEILRAMLRPTNMTSFDLDALLHRLERDYASVSYQYARLHDEPAFFIRAYLKENLHRTEDSIKNLIQRAIETLRVRLVKKQAEYLCLNERCEDDDWVKAILDLTEYLFWFDESEAWRWFIPHFVASLAYSTDLRQGLIQVAHGWVGYMNKAGKKRLKLLREGSDSNSSTEARADLLDELARLQRLGWLKVDYEDEYNSILEWQQGLLLHMRGNYADALIHYERAGCLLGEHGKMLRKILNEFLYHLSGEFIWAHGSTIPIYSIEAERMLKQVVQLDPENLSAWLRLGMTIARSVEGQNAIPCFMKAIEIDPKSAIPYNGLGNVYADTGRYEEALAAYQQAIQLDPKFAYPYSGLGSVYRSLGRYEEALAEYQQSIQLNQKSAIPHNGLGNVYRSLGKYEEALAEYQQAIQLDPRYAYPHNGLGNVYRSLGKYDEALAEYQQTIQLNPKFDKAHNGLGNMYQKIGKYEKAQAAYQQAIFLNPKLPYPHHGLGSVYRILGRYEEALAEYQQSIQLDPKAANPHDGLGNLYRQLGRYEEALAEYQQAIQLDPKFANSHKSLAGIYIHMQRLDNAISELQEGIRLDPSNKFTPLVTLGVIACNQGLVSSDKHFKDALLQWNTSYISSWQTSSELLEDRSIALLCTGYKEEALKTIKEAISQMLPGEIIKSDIFNLLQTAQNPPDGINDMIAIIEQVLSL